MKYFIVSCLSVLSLAATQSAVLAQTVTPNASQGVGNLLTYPSGSLIYGNGAISVPNGQLVQPAVTLINGDGSNTYYYSNGTRITTNPNAVSPSGTALNQGINGGLNNVNTISPTPNLNLFNRTMCVPSLSRVNTGC